MTTRKPSVTKVFEVELGPELSKAGFRKVNPKFYGRISHGDVFQYISLSVSTGVRREYRIEYGAMCLAEPQEALTLQPGGQLMRGTSGGTYGAATDTMLQKSIARVIDSFRLDLFPWFEASSTIDGFQATLEAHERSHPYLTETGHIDFTKACTASVRGEFGLAHQHLLRATELFEAKREAWGEQCLQKCVLLNNALQTGKQAELHLQWRAASIDQLDIGKLVTEAKGGN